MDIHYLADHSEFVQTLARWIYDEWSYLHPERTFEDVQRLTAAGCSRDRLPVSLVAVDDGKPVGTVTLKEKDFEGRPDLNPWLSGLYVEASLRGKGLGTKLTQGIMRLAARRDFKKLYLVTDDAVDFYAKLNWRVLEQRDWHGNVVTVMEIELS